MRFAEAPVVSVQAALCVPMGNAWAGLRLRTRPQASILVLARATAMEVGKTHAHRGWCTNMVNAWFRSQEPVKLERVLQDANPTLVELREALTSALS